MSTDLDAVAAWNAFATARDGIEVTATVKGSLVLVGNSLEVSVPRWPYAWLPIDIMPINEWAMTFLGVDLALTDVVYQAIADLNVTRSGSDIAVEQLVSLTGVRQFTREDGSSEKGFTMYSSVYDDDPTRVVLSMGASLNAYVSGINAGDQAVVTVTDHFGEVYLHATGCVEADAVQVLSGVVNITSTKRWRVDIGQCPSFTDGYIASSTKRTTASLIVGAICAAAVLMCTGLVVIVHVSEKDAKLRITVATHTESSRAHRWIIGYGTRLPVSVFYFYNNSLEILGASAEGDGMSS